MFLIVDLVVGRVASLQPALFVCNILIIRCFFPPYQYLTFICGAEAFFLRKNFKTMADIEAKAAILQQYIASKKNIDIRRPHESYRKSNPTKMMKAAAPKSAPTRSSRVVGKSMPMAEARKIIELQKTGMSFAEAVKAVKSGAANTQAETKPSAAAIPKGYQSEKDIPKNRMDEIQDEMLNAARRRGIDTNEWDRVDVNEHMARDLSEKVIRKVADVSERAGEQMAKALLGYTGAAFKNIKDASTITDQNDIMVQRYVKPLEAYISAAPKYYGDTYRGTTKTDSEINALVNSYKKGSEIAMHGISSWTRDKDVAKDFLFANTQGYEGKKNATVFVCKDKQPKGTSVSQYAPPMNESQKEVLVSKDARWRIDSHEEKTETVDGKKTKVHYFYLTAV